MYIYDRPFRFDRSTGQLTDGPCHGWDGLPGASWVPDGFDLGALRDQRLAEAEERYSEEIDAWYHDRELLCLAMHYEEAWQDAAQSGSRDALERAWRLWDALPEDARREVRHAIHA